MIVFFTLSALGIISPSLPVLAQPLHIPHENPDTASEGLPGYPTLLLSFSQIYDLASARNYPDARHMADEIQLAEIPEDLRYIFDRFQTLARSVINNINSAESSLEEARKLYSGDRKDDAFAKLEQAAAALDNARFLIVDVVSITESLGNNLKVLTLLPSSPLRQAYERFIDSLDRVSQLVSELQRLYELLAENPEELIVTDFFLPTTIDFTIPDTVYPGLPVAVSGQIYSNGESIERRVAVLLDGIRLAEKPAPGPFSIEVLLPENTSTGRHNLAITAAPLHQYEGASRSRMINVSRIPLSVDIQSPPTMTIPGSIRVSGTVHTVTDPLANAKVNLSLMDSSAAATTAADGSFSIAMDAPLDFSLVKPREIRITVTPLEPWNASLEITEPLVSVNLLGIGATLAIIIALGLLAYYKRGSGAPWEAPAAPQVLEEPLPATVSLPPPMLMFLGVKGKILSAYRDGLEMMEKATGVLMAPDTTLHEFLESAQSRSPVAIAPFRELTAIAEEALYSSQRLSDDIADQADQFIADIQEELRRGTA